MIIDSHVHIGLNEFCIDGKEKFKFDLENSVENYLKFMRSNGIDKAVILPIPSVNYDIQKSNEYLDMAASTYADTFYPFCRMDLDMSGNLLQRNFYGAKYHMVYEEYKNRELLNYYRELEHYGFPLMIHAKYIKKEKQITDILKIAPKLNIIVAHMGRGNIYTDEGVEQIMQAFCKKENIYFETSTVGRQRAIEKACSIIGSERIIFGTDYPFGKAWFGKEYSYKDEIAVVEESNISEAEKDNIFCNSIMKIISEIKAKKQQLLVRLVKESDVDYVWERLKNLIERDKKFLAIESKWSVVRSNLKARRHIYVAEIEGNIVGCFRESGREKGSSLLEEVVVFPEFRGNGYAGKMLDYYLKMFPVAYAKTNTKNDEMIHLLEKKNFMCEGGTRILNWRRNDDL